MNSLFILLDHSSLILKVLSAWIIKIGGLTLSKDGLVDVRRTHELEVVLDGALKNSDDLRGLLLF